MISTMCEGRPNRDDHSVERWCKPVDERWAETLAHFRSGRFRDKQLWIVVENISYNSPRFNKIVGFKSGSGP